MELAVDELFEKEAKFATWACTRAKVKKLIRPPITDYFSTFI